MRRGATLSPFAAGGAVEGLGAGISAGFLGSFRAGRDDPFLLEFAAASLSGLASAEPFLALLRAAG